MRFHFAHRRCQIKQTARVCRSLRVYVCVCDRVCEKVKQSVDRQSPFCRHTLRMNNLFNELVRIRIPKYSCTNANVNAPANIYNFVRLSIFGSAASAAAAAASAADML